MVLLFSYCHCFVPQEVQGTESIIIRNMHILTMITLLYSEIKGVSHIFF